MNETRSCVQIFNTKLSRELIFHPLPIFQALILKQQTRVSLIAGDAEEEKKESLRVKGVLLIQTLYLIQR